MSKNFFEFLKFSQISFLIFAKIGKIFRENQEKNFLLKISSILHCQVRNGHMGAVYEESHCMVLSAVRLKKKC